MSSLHDAALGLLDPVVATPEDRARYATALREWADTAEHLGHLAMAKRYRDRADYLDGIGICESLRRQSDFYAANPRVDAGPDPDDACPDCGKPADMGCHDLCPSDVVAFVPDIDDEPPF